SENCFLTSSRSIRYFDTLAQELEEAAAAPPNSITSELNGAQYTLLALLAGVYRDLGTGHYILSNTFGESCLSTTHKPPVSVIDNYGTILNVHNYMKFHIDQPLSIDGMARHAVMSRSQFTRQFR